MHCSDTGVLERDVDTCAPYRREPPTVDRLNTKYPTQRTYHWQRSNLQRAQRMTRGVGSIMGRFGNSTSAWRQPANSAEIDGSTKQIKQYPLRLETESTCTRNRRSGYRSCRARVSRCATTCIPNLSYVSPASRPTRTGQLYFDSRRHKEAYRTPHGRLVRHTGLSRDRSSRSSPADVHNAATFATLSSAGGSR